MANLLQRILGIKTAPTEVIAEQSIQIGMTDQPEWPHQSLSGYIKDGYEGNELIYACVRKIATSAAHARMILQTASEMGEDPEEIVAGDVPYMLRSPNEDDTQLTFLDYMHTSLQVSGNAYVMKERIGRRVVNLWTVAPQDVGMVPGRRGVAQWVVKRKGQEFRLPAEDVRQLKLTSLSNEWFGMAPLATATKIANLDMSATDFSKIFFQNAGVPRGLLKLKRRMDGGEQEANVIRAKWKARMAGLNRHEIAVLDENAEYEKLGSGLDDLELESLRDLVESRICAAFGVPPILVGANVGLKRSTYANYEEARESFWQETLLPLYRRIGDFMTKLVAEEWEISGQEVGWDFSEVAALQESEQEKAEAFRTKATSAAVLINAGFERAAVLEAVGLPEIEEAPEPEPIPEPEPQLQIIDGGQPALAAPVKSLSVSEEAAFLRVQQASFDDAVGDLEEIYQGEFTKQLRRADGIMGQYIAEERKANGTKATVVFDASTLIPPTADDELIAASRNIILDVAARSWVALDGPEILRHIAFDPENPAIQQVLKDASTRVVGINETTRKAINETISVGKSRGYSIEQIARGVEKDGYAGIRSKITETYKNRARAIARTEVRTAQNQTTAARYLASGIQYVDIRDGDEDAPCAQVNGTRQTVQWYAENPASHPNCTRGAVPVVEVQPVLTGSF